MCLLWDFLIKTKSGGNILNWLKSLNLMQQIQGKNIYLKFTFLLRKFKIHTAAKWGNVEAAAIK